MSPHNSLVLTNSKDKNPADQSGYCVSRIQTNGEDIVSDFEPAPNVAVRGWRGTDQQWILGDAFLVNVSQIAMARKSEDSADGRYTTPSIARLAVFSCGVSSEGSG